jgi:hypothetical protein
MVPYRPEIHIPGTSIAVPVFPLTVVAVPDISHVVEHFENFDYESQVHAAGRIARIIRASHRRRFRTRCALMRKRSPPWLYLSHRLLLAGSQLIPPSPPVFHADRHMAHDTLEGDCDVRCAASERGVRLSISLPRCSAISFPEFRVAADSDATQTSRYLSVAAIILGVLLAATSLLADVIGAIAGIVIALAGVALLLRPRGVTESD